jgi:hypothetical protein
MATFQFYSFIQNVATGNVLDVSGGNSLPFTQVIAYPQKTTASGQGNQLWAHPLHGPVAGSGRACHAKTAHQGDWSTSSRPCA